MFALEGKKLLVTGLVTKESIAFEVARQAQEAGAEIVLTSFGRAMSLTERMAGRLPRPPDVLELDVNNAGQLEAVAADLERRWGALDGVVHSIAYAPDDALGGSFLETPPESAEAAFRTSAHSFKGLTAAMLPLLEHAQEGGSVVGLDFDARFAWPGYNWMGVSKAALEAVGRYLAREVGPRGVRVNLVASGPLETLAAGAIPGFEQIAETWREQAPLGWDTTDAGPVASAALFLLSPAARGISGEILHVDGGFHAVGC